MQDGLRDTLRLHQKKAIFSAGGITECSPSEKNRGLRIDAILASKALVKKCTASGIDREMRRAKSLPIMLQCGQSFKMTCHPEQSRGIPRSYPKLTLRDSSTPLRSRMTLFKLNVVNRTKIRVSNPPPKALLIWDGECHFCR